jgi:CheY-like chemotaxis protein
MAPFQRDGTGGEAARQQPRLVLVVDDDDDICFSIGELLRNPSVQVETARNGIEAVSRARVLKPQMMILDVQLPGMDGFEVFRVLKQDQDLHGVKVILLSAYASASAPRLA